MKELELGSKIVYDSHGIPLNKFKDKGDAAGIMDDLRKGKEKLRQAQVASFNVKNKFQKQLEDKRKLQAQMNKE